MMKCLKVSIYFIIFKYIIIYYYNKINLHLAEESIDTMPQRKGMPLKQMATNRQRCGLDTHEKWLAELERRDAVEEEAKRQKEVKAKAKLDKDALNPNVAAVKMRTCSNLNCPDDSKTLMNKKNKTWTKCTTKNCSVWACHLQTCKESVRSHTQKCNPGDT